MSDQNSAEVIAAIRSEIDEAADQILSETESCLRLLNGVREEGPGKLDDIAAGLTRIMEACAFQDLVGQRLSQLTGATGYSAKPSDSLLNGPALSGQGLDQATADRLMQSPPSSPPPSS